MPISVFLSTVSDEFLAYRKQLKGDLTRHNVAVKVQEDFQDLGGDTLDKLDTYIANCDAVVHLVGDMTGSAPAATEERALIGRHPDLAERLPPLGEALKNGVPISYTQWEAWLALYHGRPLMIARARKTALRGPKYLRDHESRAAQAAHLARLEACRRFPGYEFGSPDGLAKHIAYSTILDLLVKDYAAREARARHLAEGFIKELAQRVVGDKELDFDGMKQAVRNAVEIYEKEIAGRPADTNIDDIVKRALARAREQVDQGRSGLARATLRRAAETMQREEHERREQFVASLTALGHRERDIALAAYDGDAAAAAIAALARAVHGERPAKAADFLRSEARALYEHGSDRGSNVHLVAAIALQRELLGLAASEEERGAESAGLALALLKLGARESGRTRLEEALAILRLVLKEFTPETAPFDWSAAQANLGVALKTLSERVSGSGWLEEAVEAHRAALKQQMRERDWPLWASTQNNLGNALAQMGQRRLDTAPLEKAIEAYQAALEVFTRERLPLDWARTQNNLGSAFLSLGERQPMAGWFEKSIQAYSAALQVLSRKEAPLDWAAAQSNLGFVLLRLCERDIALEPGGPRASDFRAGARTGPFVQGSLAPAISERLRQAVSAFQASLEERTRARAPLDWAGTQNNLANALLKLGAGENGTARIEEAVAAYGAALQEYTRDQAPAYWAMSFANQGVAMMLMADRTNDGAMAETALKQIQIALDSLGESRDVRSSIYFRAQLPRALAIRDRLKGR
ncbi:MAG: tetratricopeptide repeat protein [Roseiarcus sp.]